MRTLLRFACGLMLSSSILAGLAINPAFADSLTYDPVGNVATRTTSFGTTTYTYDAVNRLTAESGPAGNFSYSYDANGSRLSDSGGSYTYSATSNRLTARHGHAVTTDAAGNITSDGLGHTYVYNQRGYLSEARLNGVLLANYYYDYRGLRTRKVTTAAAPQGAQVVRFVYDEAGHLIEELSTSGAPIRTYVWRDDTPIAQIDHVPTRHIRYFATDHLNTPRAAMDETGKVIWRWESDAFGSTPANEDPDGDGVRTTVNLRFPGQYYDQETGLHYNWQRYYDPGSGEYTQPDLIGLAGGSWSTYAYTGGNPLRWVDPMGLGPNSRAPPPRGSVANEYYNSLLSQIRELRPEYRPPSSIGNRDSNVSDAEIAILRNELANLRNPPNQCTSETARLGGFKSEAKWSSQLEQRGWTSDLIAEAIQRGETFPATNLVNKGNDATRYVSPTTGQSVVVDTVTNEVIHVGGPGFKY